MNKILKVVIWIVVAVLVIWGIYSISTEESPSKISEESIKVGVILPLSGSDAYFGEQLRKGLELADKKDDSVEMIIEDFGSDVSKAPTAVSKLININNIDILLTTWTEDTRSSIRWIEEKEIPTICLACGTIGITEESKFIFRIWPSDALEVDALIKYAQSKEYNRAAILQTKSVWENSLTAYFESKWNKNQIIIESGQRSENDFKTQLTKIKQFNPEFIYLPVYEKKYPVVAKRIKELGIEAEIGTTSWINDPEILSECGKSCEGFIVPQYAPPSKNFLLEYEDEYGEKPGIGADVAYDSIKILQNLKGRTTKDILSELLTLNYSGVSGKIEMNETGDRINRKINLLKIQNQNLTQIE